MLRTRPSATPAMMAVWSDEATIAHALAFEAALARTQAEEGLICPAIADAIVRACEIFAVDAAQLADEVAHAGTLAIPLVARLRDAVGVDVRHSVHSGATSQDVADTVMALQIRAAVELVGGDLRRTVAALADVARLHARTAAVGRTLLQEALPIAWGLRAAQWAAGVAAATRRLDAEGAACATVQLGGAVGTRAAFGGRGGAVAARVADALGLRDDAPWHGRRDRVAGLASALAIAVGMLGKVARDVSLLSQGPMREAREPVVAGRGGSSAMPHKRNPTGCQLALSAALRAPGLAAGVLAGLPAELERGLGGWQAEAPALADLFLLASGAAAAMATVAEGLEVDDAAIEANLLEARLGSDLGESAELVGMLLAEAEID